ncbi:DUF423 domain-containing protein [Hufsiella ginkgonis]|uniref:DUF423 domain-containing protein n=1 Tax=Hufsiella ginkgonis TaxID=2695274 RepID=A0A7K1XYM2_9SPHI|nr:DUF423 domain-containing protein [Hufsiella ginkgonis]MXV15928.1 DUF423 domain-containing protein [Hufsiella ginkgonis]
MKQSFVITACVFGLIAVVLGAFGAHGLKDKLAADQLENWKTGVSYQFYHTLAILFLASLSGDMDKGWVNYSFICFVVGILFFSGSLYLLSTRSLTGITATRILGPVTPVGGLAFVLGWAFLLVSALKGK